jgi:alpha-beta hydrolase superfamily lysophospholipase
MARATLVVHREEEVLLEVVQQGEGPETALLVPSAARGVDDFAELADRLAESGIRSIAVNQRGTGRSEGPPEALTVHPRDPDNRAPRPHSPLLRRGK